ncbi:MAG: lamin tail domain-containing protein [Myxococcales bacterium]|nr:lamin tail domain-containing protein [Myxococcales bacterium]
MLDLALIVVVSLHLGCSRIGPELPTDPGEGDASPPRPLLDAHLAPPGRGAPDRPAASAPPTRPPTSTPTSVTVAPASSDRARCGKVVRLSEFMADPKRVPDGAGEWIELSNPGLDPVDLDGWRLTDGRRDSHLIRVSGGLIIPPGGSIVLGLEFDGRLNGGVQVDYRYEGFHLSNESDRIRLDDPCGDAVIDVIYPTDDDFPKARPGRSLEATRLRERDVPTGWKTASDRLSGGDYGTPGASKLKWPMAKSPSREGASAPDLERDANDLGSTTKGLHRDPRERPPRAGTERR